MGQNLTDIVLAVLAVGGVGTVLIEKLFGKREDKAKAQSVEIGNGMTAMEFYQAIEKAVESRLGEVVKPYEDKVAQLTEKNSLLSKQVIDLTSKVSEYELKSEEMRREYEIKLQEMKQSYEEKLEQFYKKSCLQESCGIRLQGVPVE